MSEFHRDIYQLLNETHQILAKTTPPLSQTSSRTPNQIKHSNKTIKQPYIRPSVHENTGQTIPQDRSKLSLPKL